jgi:hypothetical protein
MHLVLSLFDKYSRDSIAARILDVVARAEWKSLCLTALRLTDKSIKARVGYAEHCARRAMPGAGVRLLKQTGLSPLTSHPLHIHPLLRTKHPEPSHTDRDPIITHTPHTHTHTQTHTYLHIYMYIHTYIHTYVHTYIHTYIHIYITYIYVTNHIYA